MLETVLLSHTGLVKCARSSMHFKWNLLHCIIMCLSDRDLAWESLHQDIESFGHKSGCWNLVCLFCLAFYSVNGAYEEDCLSTYHSSLNYFPSPCLVK